MVIMSKDITLRFAANLKKFRQARKLTQQKLADLTGIEYKYIQRLESKKPPAVRLDTLARLAKVLRIQSSKFIS